MGKKKDKLFMLHTTVKGGMLEDIRAILEKGDDINQSDEDSTTPFPHHKNAQNHQIMGISN